MYPLIRQSLVLAILTPLLGTAAAAQEADQELARQGFLLVKQYCYGCHGVKFNGSAQFNVLDRESLLSSEASYVVPGKVDEAFMWQRIDSGEMPPEGQPQPTAAEKEILKKWIDAGAPMPPPPGADRAFKREEQVLTEILADLQKTRQVDRAYQRYFSLVHLYNHKAGVSEFDLRLYRAALSKALNSLSWEPEIVVPQAIDAEQTLFRVDLRDLGWDAEDWKAILKAYPYGLKFNRLPDQQFAELDRQVELFSGTPLAYVRADWFAVSATRPPLYHVLLNIPQSDRELEQRLRVDVDGNFQRNRAKRAGFAESGVSTANRLVERHPAAYGYYWESYDFKGNNRKGNLFQLPLGPKFQGNPFKQFAFEQDGGEIIFALPNRLQGYMLVDGQGRRIDEGPIDVVRDLKETSGSPVVVNGISCMHCHQQGMIRFKDTVRSGAALFGEPRQKVQELYPEPREMDKLVERDSQQFLKALEQATGAFLQVAEDRNKPIEQIAEPIGAIARFHQRDVTLQEAALELGIEDPDQLKFAIKTNAYLKRLGLAPLANGHAVDRAVWESREQVTSPFQEAARVLDRGTPLVFLGN